MSNISPDLKIIDSNKEVCDSIWFIPATKYEGDRDGAGTEGESEGGVIDGNHAQNTQTTFSKIIRLEYSTFFFTAGLTAPYRDSL